MITQQQQQQNFWSLTTDKLRYYNVYSTRRLKGRNDPMIK